MTVRVKVMGWGGGGEKVIFSSIPVWEVNPPTSPAG